MLLYVYMFVILKTIGLTFLNIFSRYCSKKANKHIYTMYIFKTIEIILELNLAIINPIFIKKMFTKNNTKKYTK